MPEPWKIARHEEETISRSRAETRRLQILERFQNRITQHIPSKIINWKRIAPRKKKSRTGSTEDDPSELEKIAGG